MRTSSRRLRHSLPLALLGALAASTACLRAPQVHPRALENNELCAQYISNGLLDRAEVHCDLGLEFSEPWTDVVDVSYGRLWNDWRAAHPGAPSDMLLP